MSDDDRHLTIVALGCRGALVDQDGLQVILLAVCFTWRPNWGLIRSKIYTEWETEPVTCFDLHHFLHSHKGYVLSDRLELHQRTSTSDVASALNYAWQSVFEGDII